ncbi:MFS transporter [Streptomyces sp. NBC_01558]|uniref:MFS transporter n=1 Tax=Streptomyces sp. NBC_01558 TaxID=2975878 RepID=UPI002DDC8BCC|nr:MFS transporter [Streptomyces sp. NBC_01558]WSD76783.1 MFS transporter [Streptomyces sp. NBC_01558]WSD76796.1 MFS transporter [Streptomyces sp. NBC_01558]
MNVISKDKKDKQAQPGLGSSFNKVWVAAIASSWGDGVQMAALPLLAIQLTTDPLLIGAVGAIGTLPWFLLGLPAGALVDRWDRRKVMLRADLVRFTILTLLTLAVLTDHANITLLIAAGFALGCGDIFFDISAQAVLPVVVTGDQALIRANSRISAAQINGEQLAGPPIGGVLFSLSHSLPFLGNALSFLISALCVNSLKGNFANPPTTQPTTTSLRTEVAEGLRWLLKHRVLRTLAGTAAIGNLVFTAKMSLLVLLAKNQLGLGDIGYGLLLSSTAVGAFIGSFLSAPISKKIQVGTMRCVGMSIEGLAVLGLGLTTSPWIAGAMMATIGFSMSVQIVIVGALRQRLAPTEIRGRVLSASRLISLMGAPFGGILAGYLASTTSLRTPFITGGLLMIIVALASLPALSNHAIQQATNETTPTEPTEETTDTTPKHATTK